MSGVLGAAELVALAGSLGGAFAVFGGAFALGLRHGIDWDHIAAITDITSTTATAVDEQEAGLTREPGLQLTDEGHHRLTAVPADGAAAGGDHRAHAAGSRARAATPAARFIAAQRSPVLLGTCYALGHATVVTLLGLAAILAAGRLPAWIDPIMGRVVGVTLLLLAAYLYYSIYRFFRGGQFRLRSRWMLVFAAARNATRWVRWRAHGQGRHDHAVAHEQRYGWRSAYGIGLIHGIGAETGTQVLVIATAVGAASRAAGLLALLAFVAGLLVSNTVVTVATAVGFVSASRRQWLYVAAGFLAATFSLALGTLFVLAEDGRLPSLDPYLTWLGGSR